ncbi:MAG: DinB family protein [Bacteroidia bacterium]|nr:DinB family protein [Bacteroidia bacterium]
MSFTINNSIELLKRSPQTLHSILYNVDENWSHKNEGGDTWSPFDVIGHLIHCDEYNWILRLEIMLSDSVIKNFEPFDRFAQLQKSKGKTINQLLDEFVKIRLASIEKLIALNITNEQLSKSAIHPELGSVTVSQLISTWVVHDLDHIAQICRVMAKQYKEDVGPWIKNLKILRQQ